MAATALFMSGCGGSSSSITDDSSDTSTVTEGNSLVINEIVAKDSAGGDDWIELYVTQGSINLSDYTLIDDDEEGELKSLPDMTITAGEFVVIRAIDEDDITTQEDDLYVAFKLGSSDSVSLYNGNELVDIIEWDKGEALTGFSYGRYNDGIGTLQTLSPTRASGNVQASRGPLVINEVVSKDVDDGDDWFELYNSGTQALNLSDYTVVDDTDDLEALALPDVSLEPGEFAVIYATETDPGVNYVPFKLGSSDSLTLELDRVTVDYVEWDDSDAPQGYSYGAYPDGDWSAHTLSVSQGTTNTDVTVFETDSVESIYITLADDDWQDIIDNAEDKEDHTASVTYKNVTLENIAFRTKGNSTLSHVATIQEGSTGYSRFSFKIDTNEYISGQKLLNMKKLNFNNNYNDPSYMRETISYNVMRELGLAAPRTSFVNLYINDELHGLYTMVEQVNDEFLEDNFSNSNGDLYKPDDADNEGLVGHDLVWIDAAYASYTAVELKTNEDTTENTALMSFLYEINNGSDYDSVLDSDAMLRYLAASTVMSNLDSYQGTLSHNYYLYEQDGLFSIIPWDFNESFGTFTMGCGDVTELYIDEPTQGALSERPLIAALLSSDENLETYHAYISALINAGGLDPAVISEEINAFEILISTSVANDPSAFYSYSQFESGLVELLSFAMDRADNVQQQLNGSAASSGDGSGYCTDADMPSGPGGPP
ncbi:MAG: CotH kinase family protein [Bermanella sp.]